MWRRFLVDSDPLSNHLIGSNLPNKHPIKYKNNTKHTNFFILISYLQKFAAAKIKITHFTCQTKLNVVHFSHTSTLIKIFQPICPLWLALIQVDRIKWSRHLTRTFFPIFHARQLSQKISYNIKSLHWLLIAYNEWPNWSNFDFLFWNYRIQTMGIGG